MRKKIEKLLMNGETAYAIAKGSGVPCSTITDLRGGKRSLDLLSLINVEKLLAYIEKNEPKKIDFDDEPTMKYKFALAFDSEEREVYYEIGYFESNTKLTVDEAIEVIGSDLVERVAEKLVIEYCWEGFDFRQLKVIPFES